MLPLWIIDLRGKSDRRDCFLNLIGQVDHIFIANTSSTELSDSMLSENDSALKGNYWRYSCLGDNTYDVSISSNDGNRIYDGGIYDSGDTLQHDSLAEYTASQLYRFQEDLVSEGQAFIKDLRLSNAHPDIKINIVVLGDLTEDFTRIVFPSVARILQKEKGRMLPHHIHQGMEIIGMIFIPSNINTLHVKKRRSMQRTLNEVEVQHCVNEMRGYDHMMYYQDVQNRTECSFSLLDDEHLAQYLFQCIVHLYLACDKTHPLLSGTTSADMFYFSMGVTSLHYNSANESIAAQNKLARDVMRALRSTGLDENKSFTFPILDEKFYKPEVLLDNFSILSKFDEDLVYIEPPSPHPYRNFLHRRLKRYYYDLYLRYFSKNLMQDIHRKVESCSIQALEAIAIKSKKDFAEAQKFIIEQLRNIIGSFSADDGGIPKVSLLFREMQNRISIYRNDVRPIIERKYWQKIEEKYVSSSINDDFIEYHDAYVSDIKNKTEGKLQMELKKTAIDNLDSHISQESTLLSVVSRSLLLGIMMVLAGIPLLSWISPSFVNLGDIRHYSLWWSILLFVIPLLIQLFKIIRYQRKKKILVNKLLLSGKIQNSINYLPGAK